MMTDLLSDILRSIRLSGGIFLEARFTAPWCVEAQIKASHCRALLAEPVQMIGYHYVLEGSLLLIAAPAPPITVGAGEIVLLPHNGAHVLASAAGLPAISAGTLIQPTAAGTLLRIEHGGGGAETRLVCGFLGSDEAYSPLIDSLPTVLRLIVEASPAGGWIDATMRFAAAELAAGRPASSDMLSRLSELLLAEAIRGYVATLPADEAGWLKGIGDPQVGRALALIHRDLGTAWTAETLASAVAMSRSAFVERFGALVGQPPIRYLTMQRLQTARRQLRDRGTPVGRLAPTVGYASEEAFSRAFKREFGLSPSQWREQSAAE